MVRIFLFVQIEKLIQEGMELEYLKLVFVEKYYNIFLLLIFLFFFQKNFFSFLNKLCFLYDVYIFEFVFVYIYMCIC